MCKEASQGDLVLKRRCAELERALAASRAKVTQLEEILVAERMELAKR